MDFRVCLWVQCGLCFSVMLVLLAYQDRCILMTLSKNCTYTKYKNVI